MTSEVTTRTDAVIQGENAHIVQTYRRPPFMLVHGEGMTLYDSEGNAYLDWVAGIAVNALGYGDEGLANAMREQLATGLIHTSNLYYTAPQVQLAEKLVEQSFADRVYFCNSGAEATEAAIKFARKRSYNLGKPEKHKVVTFSGGFHGRTMGALALTPREKYQKPYAPLMPGAVEAAFNDLNSAREAIDDHTAAVFVEPIQGEGGINLADADFLRELRRLCDQHDVLLVFDEVQCGVGRTGTLWAHEPAGISPDMMTLAKPLAGGLPVGAVLTTEAVASVMRPGDHGSTFAGGPVVSAAALEVLSRVSQPGFLKHVAQVGDHLMDGLKSLEHKAIKAVRGLGLMAAVEFDRPVNPVIQAGYKHGLLMVNAGPNVLRFVPPLIAETDHVDHLMDRLPTILETALHE